jgi:hypothetical protein
MEGARGCECVSREIQARIAGQTYIKGRPQRSLMSATNAGTVSGNVSHIFFPLKAAAGDSRDCRLLRGRSRDQR